MNYLKLFFVLFFLSWKVNSQHINYSQFYSSPLNLNPAMTGLGEFGRLGVIYRNQWPNIGDGLHYVSSWIDYNFLESNFALGLNFSKENQNCDRCQNHKNTQYSDIEIQLMT